MREIKFRVWHKYALSMQYYSEPQFMHLWGDWDDSTVLMQFTGLKDINGADVYEGDVLRNILGATFAIEWDDECVRFRATGDTTGITRSYIASCERIGNIHADPDLLEKEVAK